MMTREEFETLKDWITDRTNLLIKSKLFAYPPTEERIQSMLDKIDWDASLILVTKYPDEE